MFLRADDRAPTIDQFFGVGFEDASRLTQRTPVVIGKSDGRFERAQLVERHGRTRNVPVIIAFDLRLNFSHRVFEERATG